MRNLIETAGKDPKPKDPNEAAMKRLRKTLANENSRRGCDRSTR
jgi:hypothetical protein